MIENNIECIYSCFPVKYVDTLYIGITFMLYSVHVHTHIHTQFTTYIIQCMPHTHTPSVHNVRAVYGVYIVHCVMTSYSHTYSVKHNPYKDVFIFRKHDAIPMTLVVHLVQSVY